MITSAIIRVLWGIVSPLLNLIPNVTIDFVGIKSTGAFQYIQAGLYFFPMATVLQIFAVIIALWGIRVVVALLHSLWAALPIV